VGRRSNPVPARVAALIGNEQRLRLAIPMLGMLLAGGALRRLAGGATLMAAFEAVSGCGV
jgi:hypothetical protein